MILDLSNLPENVSFLIHKSVIDVLGMGVLRYVVEIGGIPHVGTNLQQTFDECCAEYKILCEQEDDYHAERLTHVHDTAS